MAKLIRSISLSALVEGKPDFTVGPGRFSIGITSREGTVNSTSATSKPSCLRPLWRTNARPGNARPALPVESLCEVEIVAYYRYVRPGYTRRNAVRQAMPNLRASLRHRPSLSAQCPR